MRINNVDFNVELSDILNDLRADLTNHGISLFDKGFKNSGDDIMMQCPYHSGGNEHRASAGIRKSDGVFHCFACGETHSLIEFISHCFQKDEIGIFGWNWLIKRYITIKVEERNDIKLDLDRSKVSRRNRCSDYTVDDSYSSFSNYVSEEELDSYRYIHPYMYERGLTDEVIELFDVGYDKSTRCITFPVRDAQGHCLFIARRSVDYKFFNYPRGVEKPLYGLYEFYRCIRGARGSAKTNYAPALMSLCGEVVVCESMLDALSFWTIGKYAVALNGLGNELQFQQLRGLPCRKLILCTDMDKAGLNARKRIRQNVRNKLITEYFLPEGRKDANDCTRDELINLKDALV